MQSTSDVWSNMAIFGHWRPPIANRLWIHQHPWYPKIPSTQGDRTVKIVFVCFHCMSLKCLIRCSPLLARDLFMRGMCYILLVVPSPICTAGVKASKTFSDLKTGVGSFKDQPCLIKDSLFGKTTELLPILMVSSTLCNFFSHSETNPPFWQVAEVLLRAISG